MRTLLLPEGEALVKLRNLTLLTVPTPGSSITLCNLYFRNNLAYSNDKPKVTFTLSFLRGIALEYFEPSILDSDETPSWIDNWSTFIQTLWTQFGPIDPTADTENGINNLKMQENQCIMKHNVEFTCLAIQPAGMILSSATGIIPALRNKSKTSWASRVNRPLSKP